MRLQVIEQQTDAPHIVAAQEIEILIGLPVARIVEDRPEVGWRLRVLRVRLRPMFNMTRPAQRAQEIANCVGNGTLSDQRGTYVTAAAATGV